jgi:hypothetical protein
MRRSAVCQAAFNLPPPDPEGVPGQADDSQQRIKTLLQELDAAPPAPKPPPSGYARDYKDATRKTKVMGARLDSRLAGDTVIGVNAEPEEPHEELFATGVKAMKAGEYQVRPQAQPLSRPRPRCHHSYPLSHPCLRCPHPHRLSPQCHQVAVTAFTRAVAAVPGGLSSRVGGQYSVWLAQALQANGRNKEAIGLLKRCESHPDRDVRKISESVLFVFQAPELKLGKENFVQMDAFGSLSPWGEWQPRKRDPDKEPPEKYSVEWFLAEYARQEAIGWPVPNPNADRDVLLSLLGSAGILVLMAVVL